MTDSFDDDEVSNGAGSEFSHEFPVAPTCPETLFGDYCVLSPGVEIVIEGRPVSAPGD